MGACRPVGYAPRPTATSDLVRIAAESLPAFLERVEHDGGTLPGFVTDELHGVLRCGDFEYGFVQLACTRCGDALRVPFSCKGRGVCPSCIGRRMCETAANWVTHLLPEIPYRQWVLSFDSSLAVRLGYDADALGLVCRSFGRHVMRRIRGCVKQQHGLSSVGNLHPGIVTVVQRFRSDCGLYVHLHTLATDGAFALQPNDTLAFHPVTALSGDDLARVLSDVAADLANAGLSDALDIDAALAACVQLSLSTRADSIDLAPTPKLVVSAHGLNLHAATVVDGRDRRRLERLCKYLLRPPFSRDAVHRLPDGRVALELPRKGRCIEMTAEQFIAKLVALVPPPYFNLVRYAGVFHNRHHLRPLIMPPPQRADAPPHQLALFDVAGKPLPATPPTRDSTPPAMPRRSWAWLLAYVFSTDVTRCPRPRCGGRLRIVEVVRDPDAIALHLHGARAPPRPPPPGQLSLLPR